MPMGDFRARRIAQVLGSAKNHTVETVQKLHYDTYSLQAEEYLPLLRPLLDSSAFVACSEFGDAIIAHVASLPDP